MKVAVTGAGGRTGSLCMKLLAESADFAPPRGLVRSDKSAAKVKKLVGGDSDDAVEVVIGDVSDPSACDALVEGCDSLVILTSAVPKPKIASIVVAVVSKILPWMDAKRPEFYFPDEGRPELVDWLYQKNQIDAAKKAGVKKVVLVSSMGGTQIDNFLNTMGDANILLWKRKAEMYLKASGLDYTCGAPGRLAGQRRREAGEFILQLVILLIIVWAIRLTSCFVYRSCWSAWTTLSSTGIGDRSRVRTWRASRWRAWRRPRRRM
jgi:uncharacterized protein YbjT (DUF2867 family)